MPSSGLPGGINGVFIAQMEVIPLKYLSFYIALSLSLSACQSYFFEELPPSVIKEIRVVTRITIVSKVDVLFVIDNSGSMAGEQRQLARSFSELAAGLELAFGDQYRIAVVTSGMLSEPNCPLCSQQPSSCINDSGESGVLQDLLGKNEGSDDRPQYVFESDPSCQIVTSSNPECAYDPIEKKGTLLVGANGCGYERGLASMRAALSHQNSASFLREEAVLAVFVISDEEDCGEVGDVSEGLAGIAGNVCYFASKGVGPEDTTNDPLGLPYRLTPVEDYYNFLLDLKDNRVGMVKFAAIVGVKDVTSLSSTTIEYSFDAARQRYEIDDACSTPGCSGDYCHSEPGTRYIKLAQMFGIGNNGLVDTICQSDFSETMKNFVELVRCPRRFHLTSRILDPDLANILINGVGVPFYSRSLSGQTEECSEPDDLDCETGRCVRSWKYCSPTQPAEPAHACLPSCPAPHEKAPGGQIVFAPHFNPCDSFAEGEEVHIEFVYATW